MKYSHLPMLQRWAPLPACTTSRPLAHRKDTQNRVRWPMTEHRPTFMSTILCTPSSNVDVSTKATKITKAALELLHSHRIHWSITIARSQVEFRNCFAWIRRWTSSIQKRYLIIAKDSRSWLAFLWISYKLSFDASWGGIPYVSLFLFWWRRCGAKEHGIGPWAAERRDAPDANKITSKLTPICQTNNTYLLKDTLANSYVFASSDLDK